jgi:N6-L-threonylcarbamoyladenine synthase
MRILAIDTSCDETASAVTDNSKVLSNVVWSQAKSHAKFGGVMPSLAQRMHEDRIDFVIEQALRRAKTEYKNLDALAVTIGPGLSIALGVGIDRAKKLSVKYKKPLIAVNHIESHLLSPLAGGLTSVPFPTYGLVVSGGNTIFVLIENVGHYIILAQTSDDALGEALDKGARMLGLGYPGGAILEKMAKLGNLSKFTLPIPLAGQEKRQMFSYSGLKTSFYRLIEAQKKVYPDFPTKQDVYDLAATYQDIAFKHIERVIGNYLLHSTINPTNLLLGGGVASNVELRRRLRHLCKKYGITLRVPYTKRLCGDNAAMIGVCANLNPMFIRPDNIDRNPRAKLSP